MTTEARSAAESRTLALLDRIARSAGVRARIDATAARLEQALRAAPSARMAWEDLPLAIFDPGLPASIRSAWVFVLRGGAVTGAERHPNSHQRTLSWRGEGDLQTRSAGDRWTSHRLESEAAGPLRRRWVSIPPGTWHQVAVPGEDWVVLSFHTAAAEDLVEERPGRSARATGPRRRYVGETVR